VRVSIGYVPIVWNNADDPDWGPTVPHDVILDELARLGYEGAQYGRGFPEGEALARELDARGLRLAEWYCPLPAGPNGLAGGAGEAARRTLERMVAAGGEVLVVALDLAPERDRWSGRVASGAPQWPVDAYRGLAELLGELAAAAPDGVSITFHPHTATWVEAPDEVEALADALAGSRAGLCLDVGHYTVGGGDPVAAVRRFGRLVRHVHMKDVEPDVLERLRAGELDGFMGAIRQRLFTELGRGVLNLRGVVHALDEIGYAGWLMVEQDSSWLPPAEAAELGGRALREALTGLDR
jgi:inosose dehydratase